MIINERDIRHEQVIASAKQMMTAARTAPKGKGIDVIETVILTEDDIDRLSEELIRMNKETSLEFYVRDAENIKQAECIVLIGTKEQAQGLNCKHCGFDTCAARTADVPCAINCVDVGIAIGSAVSKAADLRLDTRIMFSAGLAAERLDILQGCKQVYAIPVSASSKNPFFDRKPKEETKD